MERKKKPKGELKINLPEQETSSIPPISGKSLRLRSAYCSLIFSSSFSLCFDTVALNFLSVYYICTLIEGFYPAESGVAGVLDQLLQRVRSAGFALRKSAEIFSPDTKKKRVFLKLGIIELLLLKMEKG